MVPTLSCTHNVVSCHFSSYPLSEKTTSTLIPPPPLAECCVGAPLLFKWWCSKLFFSLFICWCWASWACIALVLFTLHTTPNYVKEWLRINTAWQLLFPFLVRPYMSLRPIGPWPQRQCYLHLYACCLDGSIMRIREELMVIEDYRLRCKFIWWLLLPLLLLLLLGWVGSVCNEEREETRGVWALRYQHKVMVSCSSCHVCSFLSLVSLPLVLVLYCMQCPWCIWYSV